MNKEQGDICEAFATFYYMSLGYIVSKPLTQSPYYDIIVDMDGTLKRVECKSSRCKDNPKSYIVTLGTSGGNQSWNKLVKTIDSRKVDEIFILDGDGNYYIYDSKDLHGRRTVNVNNTLKNFMGNQQKITLKI